MPFFWYFCVSSKILNKNMRKSTNKVSILSEVYSTFPFHRFRLKSSPEQIFKVFFSFYNHRKCVWNVFFCAFSIVDRNRKKRRKFFNRIFFKGRYTYTTYDFFSRKRRYTRIIAQTRDDQKKSKCLLILFIKQYTQWYIPNSNFLLLMGI